MTICCHLRKKIKDIKSCSQSLTAAALCLLWSAQHCIITDNKGLNNSKSRLYSKGKHSVADEAVATNNKVVYESHLSNHVGFVLY